ncbi:GTP 3',8-cyclase MoaA [Paludisphaera soli]|uniref:GTP 3',8-cyclase MoaA n=1 Tax=Paludisphaera soli TaxID=2712865 RepID=UPI0013EDC645|nr:GTP 3',8-cyclase MoaA [Paludisphaera soli]
MSPTPGRLVDSFGRVHNNLRISVTDRCNIRCVYCMPETVKFMPRDQLLSFEEIARFVGIVAPLGVDKIRLTGGEPLLRKDLDVLIRMLVAIEGVADVGLTTNGMLLAPVAAKLRDAGLERINVSLDTLDPARFERLSRRKGLEDAIEGVLAAKRAGFDPVKLNAVIIRGFNEEDVAPLARFAREHALEMRFIEYMPLDAGHLWEREKVVFAQEILDVLASEVGPLAPSADRDPRAPALDYDYLDGGGRVGLIASVSRPFCLSCNRLRLTSDGKLRNCLFALDETDVKGLLRSGGPAEEVERAVAASVAAKWEGHEINTARFIQPDRPMYSIGG